MQNKQILWLSIIVIIVIAACAIYFFGGGSNTSFQSSYIDNPTAPTVTGFEVYQVPNMAEPQARTPYKDEVFGTYVVRVTDRTTDLAADDESNGMKNEYSRVQSFNSNGEYILVRGTESTWYIYDAETLKPIQSNIPVRDEPRWDVNDPNKLYYNEETKLMVYDVQSQQSSVVHDFADDLPGEDLAAVWSRYEGSPSMDGRYWGLMAQDEEGNVHAYLVYDQDQDQVIAKKEINSDVIDAVTISPLGNYFLACDDNRGMVVYDRQLTKEVAVIPNVGHVDAALDAQNKEVIVYQDTGNDTIAMADLETGEVTSLWPIDFSHAPLGFHISGRALNKPGWALISCYGAGSECFTWMDNQIFAIELKPNGTVARLAHHHSVYNEGVEQDYWAEPQASVNQDFTKILFTSNWGRTGTDEVDMYMIELPQNWMDNL